MLLGEMYQSRSKTFVEAPVLQIITQVLMCFQGLGDPQQNRVGVCLAIDKSQTFHFHSPFLQSLFNCIVDRQEVAILRLKFLLHGPAVREHGSLTTVNQIPR